MQARSGYFPAIFLVLILVFGAGSTVHYVFFAPKKELSEMTLSAVMQGRMAHDIENAIEKHNVIRDASIHLLNMFEYSVFKEARSGALVGLDQWLFTREEFEWNGKSPGNLKAAEGYIASVVSALHARSIKVALVIVPAKADIYSDRLGRFKLPTTQASLYAKILDDVRKSGADFVPDIQSALSVAKRKEQIFLTSDTHWTVAGARATASVMCAEILPTFKSPAVAMVTTELEPVQHRGDLTKFISLGFWEKFAPLPTDAISQRVTTLEAAAESGDDLLFGSSPHLQVPIAMVGTSYSANSLWSFESQIRGECKRDVLNFARDGNGPFVPMSEYLQKIEASSLEVPELVVWEIPLRQMDDFSGVELSDLQ